MTYYHHYYYSFEITIFIINNCNLSWILEAAAVLLGTLQTCVIGNEIWVNLKDFSMRNIYAEFVFFFLLLLPSCECGYNFVFNLILWGIYVVHSLTLWTRKMSIWAYKCLSFLALSVCAFSFLSFLTLTQLNLISRGNPGALCFMWQKFLEEVKFSPPFSLLTSTDFSMTFT